MQRNFYHGLLGTPINRRVLDTERLAHDCGLAPAQLADLVQPTTTPEGQPAPALKVGGRRRRRPGRTDYPPAELVPSC